MKFAFNTDRGKVREVNEDCTCIVRHDNGSILAVVCDGMGGHLGGSYAANTALKSLVDYFKLMKTCETYDDLCKWLEKTIKMINSEIYKTSLNNTKLKGMGTTLTALILTELGAACVQIGDTRLYEITEEGLKQLTKDQTLVNALLDANMITAEEASNHSQKHILTNALGTQKDVFVAMVKIEEFTGKSFLICSDGLHSMLSDEVIFQTIKNTEGVDRQVNYLIHKANQAGGQDNITVAIVETGEDYG